MNVPCPRCQKPMSVPQPVPERIKCPACGAVISTKKKDASPPAPSNVPPVQSSAPPPPAPSNVPPVQSSAPPPPAPSNVPPVQSSAPPPPAPSNVPPVQSSAPPPAPQPPAPSQPAASAPEAANGEKWFYAEPGQQPNGPVTIAELTQLATAGKIHGQTNVFRESSPQWQPAANVAELTPALQATGTGDEFNLAVNELPATAATTARSDSFLSKLHSSMSKPLLFGIYGALGGLLGALIIGELCWLLFAPAPPDIAPMKIAVAPDVTVYPGGLNSLSIKIARQKFEGPVKVEVEGAPDPVRFSRLKIDKDKSDGVFYISAEQDVRLRTYPIKLKAIAGLKGEHVVTKEIKLKVAPVPPVLNLTASAAVTVYAGGTNRLPFTIARDRFKGPVQLSVVGAKGKVNISPVTLQEPKAVKGKPTKTVKGEFRIDASRAEPAGYDLVVKAQAEEESTITAETTFRLNVEPPPGKLRLAVTPKVVLYPGTKNKVTVKIARQDFQGDISVQVVDAEDESGLPAGIEIEGIQVAAKEKQGEFVVSALADSLRGDTPVTHNLKLKAKVTTDDSIVATVPFQLVIQPPPPTLQLAVSPTVSAYPGGKATFGVKIARQRFEGPVKIQVAKPNRYADVTSVTIPAKETEGKIELSVKSTALNLKKLPAKQPVALLATTVGKGPRVVSGAENVGLEILPLESGLDLTVSPEVELYQKGKCKFFAKVTRTGFVGPVQLEFAGAPKGVTFSKGPIPDKKSSVELIGQATLNAEPGKYKIKITATGRKAPDNKTPQQTAEFVLDLKPFDPATRPPLDILFVLDVSKSMDPQIEGISNGIEQFLAALKKRDLEARIGMVAFRDLRYPDEDPLKVLKFAGKPFTDDHNLFKKEVAQLKATGGGDDPESSLDALHKAASELPFRENALKIILLVTDASYVKGGNAMPMAQTIKKLSEKKIGQVHLVVPQKFTKEYLPIQKAIKGSSFDLKKVGNTPQAFANLMSSELSEQIATAIPGKEPKKPAPPPAPPKPKAPPSLASAKVPSPPAERKPAAPRPVAPKAPSPGKVDAVEPAAPEPPSAEDVAPPQPEMPSLKGVQSDQMFAEEDQFQLLLATALWTAALAGGIALFLVSAQKRHLRHTWLSLSETGQAVGAGMVAGLLAGAVGQWFFQSTSGAAWWDVVTRVLAWGILGGLVGAGMGYVVPNVNRQRAFIGGCIGGFAGAFGFAIVSLMAHAILGRLIGAALLGLCLGIMVALVEMASRRYWLEIIFGEREIRTANLGPTTIAVGGDEKAASIYVPDAPPKAFGFRVDRNKVFCEDFVGGRTTEAAPGDMRELGKVKLRVCSAASAVPTGATLQLVVARDLSLMDGMPLTVDDIPGLEPQGSDGIVALVSKRPSDPKQFLLRNRSKQPWTIIDAEGVQKMISPGLSIELASRCEIDFGQCKATLEPGKMEAGQGEV